MTKNYNKPAVNEEYLSVVKQLEDIFKKKRKIKLIDYVHNPNTSIKNFIKDRCINDSKTTVYAISEKHQCHSNAHRSVGDLYMLTQYYYSDVTVDEFLIELAKASSEYNIGCIYCPNVQKRVFFYHYSYDCNRKDENGLRNDFYKNLKQGIYHAQ